MEFIEFKKALSKKLNDLTKSEEKLFLTDVERNDLWEHYLNSFPEGSNPVYKERREYDCQTCKQFIRPFANIVAIKNNKLISIWDIEDLESPFNEVAKSMSEFVKSAPIRNIFVSKNTNMGGADKNTQQLEDGSITTWNHFYYSLPRSHVTSSLDSIESIQGFYRDSKNVFKRSMEELTIDAGKAILELIDQKSLYRGEEFRDSIMTFILYKETYETLPEKEKDNWCWKNSIKNTVNRIRNTAIGTLLIDISENIDLDAAVTKFEKVMAPANYKRPKAIFTKKMVEDAQAKIEELGLTNSLGRRFAKLEDITINNILFANRDAKSKLKDSVFDELKKEAPINAKSFDQVEEISIEDFIKSVLPSLTNLELMIENKHSGNLMSIIAPEDTSSKTMFQWNNNFSWAYNGDIADSIKQNVKKAGGNVEGVLRFSIQWNTGKHNKNDFDAHCKEPSGNLISFSSMKNQYTSGRLDVDIIDPQEGAPAVENITWTDIDKMEEGIYQFLVHNYNHRGGRDGFSAEIEYNGQIYSYEYPHELKHKEKVLVAKLKFDKKEGITFIESLNSSLSSKKIWNVNTNHFTKVNICMFSPNYWDDQDKIGNKHYFFILDGCKNETNPRGFFNEFLSKELTSHKKVFEALGSKMRVKNSDNQLSGVGFSSTQRNSIVAKVEGAVSRIIKIIF